MNRDRILYLDVPFEHETGGDKNRSRFLWSTLQGSFDTDFGMIVPQGVTPSPARSIPPVARFQAHSGPWWDSESVFSFSPEDLQAFDQLLAERRYAAVFCRFHSPWTLARAAARHPSRPSVVVDLDMLSSRLAGLTWRQAPSLRNRWFLFESLKLARCERSLMRSPSLVLFSNPEERDDVRRRGIPQEPPAHLAVLPNVMPEPATVTSPGPGPARDPVILFFGSLNSAANTDAFRHLVDDLLPRLDPVLRRAGVRIRVVGRNPPSWFAERLARSGSDRVELVGGVPSMEAALAAARFVLLPLRIASGTRTRLLEAAAVARAVVTTPIGAEGIEVGDTAVVEQSPEALSAAVTRLIEDPAAADALGLRFQKRCRDRYSADRVGGDLVRTLSEWIATRGKASA